ncbi:MAG: hypothetical protein ACFBSF_07995 [Leptolyngbyaceae cyanobacterium]
MIFEKENTPKGEAEALYRAMTQQHPSTDAYRGLGYVLSVEPSYGLALETPGPWQTSWNGV